MEREQRLEEGKIRLKGTVGRSERNSFRNTFCKGDQLFPLQRDMTKKARMTRYTKSVRGGTQRLSGNVISCNLRIVAKPESGKRN